MTPNVFSTHWLKAINDFETAQHITTECIFYLCEDQMHEGFIVIQNKRRTLIELLAFLKYECKLCVFYSPLLYLI